MTKVTRVTEVLIGGRRYLKLEPPWIIGTRPAAKFIDMESR